jgi:hypothetical protein
VVLVLAVFTGGAFYGTRDADGAARVVPRVLILVFDILALVILVANYHDAAWGGW